MRTVCLITAVWLATCQVPEQIHISLGTLAHSITVQWVTFKPTKTTEVYLCAASCTTVTGWMRKWTYRNIAEYPVPIPRYMHIVHLVDLVPFQLYRYRVGSGSDLSPELTFAGPPHDSTPSLHRSFNETSILILGDFGVFTNRSRVTLQALIAQADQMQDTAYFHTGDLAYDLEDNNGIRGDDYMRQIQPFASKIPYMVVVGNHEKHQNFTHFKHRFHMPQGNDNMYYSVNIGPVHAIAYSSEVFCGKKRCKDVLISQRNWLINDLENAKNERKVRPWIVAFAHKPLYCSAEWSDVTNIDDCVLQPIDMKREFEDLLAAYGVDLHFHGHVHAYERTTPIYKSHTVRSSYSSTHLYFNPRAPIYVVEGSAGTSRYGDINYPSSTPEPWSVFRSAEFGYCRLEANDTSLKVTRYRSHGGIEDFFYIVKTMEKQKRQ